MLKFIDHKKMGRGKYPWLDAHYHFSFAWYHNPENINFGVLRVINDDTIKTMTGFDTHPHENMEIVTYIIDGELTHMDSMGNRRTLGRGEVQYMSAGTGITHSEHNFGTDSLRLLQIWILPDKDGHTPNYGDFKFNWEERVNKWMPIASSTADKGHPIQIHSDINMYATELEAGKSLDFEVAEGRQAYMVLIEGKGQVGDISLGTRDGLEIYEENITLTAREKTHALIIEMDKEHK